MTTPSFVATIMRMKKVLIADGLKSSIEETKRVLDGRGLSLFTVSSAEEALSLHKREKVDLIVADLDIRGTGDKLCSLIRNDASLKSVSFIMVCRNTTPDLERCANCGANAYIAKPSDPVLLLEKVSALIDIPKRASMRVLLKVSVKGSFKDQGFFSTSVNISSSGILLQTDKVISKGDKITCSFFIPRSQIITADCEVTRAVQVDHDLHRYGAKFLNLAPDQSAAINEFVRRKTD